MSSTLYLFLQLESDSSELEISQAEFPQRLSDTASWVIEKSTDELSFFQGSLNDAALAAKQHTVTVVLPGQQCLFLTAVVPGKNRQRILQAIPYVLEESVIDDVDDLHFAISEKTFKTEKSSAEAYQVAVINKAYLESIINELKVFNIQPDIMTADYFMLNDDNTLYIDEHRTLFNGAEVKFSTDLDCLRLSTNNLFPADKQIRLLTSGNMSSDSEQLAFLTGKFDIKQESCDATAEICIVKNNTNKNIINLLQGPYKKKKNWSQAGKTWLPIAALFLIWLSVQSVLFFVDYISLSNQSEQLKTEINKIYKNTFPGSRRIVDAKAQMQQKLKALRKRKGQSGRSFTEMLDGSSAILAKTQGLIIKSLRYYDGRISLELQLSNLQALDKLKKQLSDEKGYVVEIKNASSDKDFVTARVQIIGEKS